VCEPHLVQYITFSTKSVRIECAEKGVKPTICDLHLETYDIRTKNCFYCAENRHETMKTSDYCLNCSENLIAPPYFVEPISEV
jgi:hypothetical protein